ncbi:MAG TPA: TrbI/VirB10 family protein [Bryobacteraceae bacterium]|jgi:type IV secretion system protein VirB10|nr:TrbI/VirB10 family protein [Bryobacteraceae bacterium]
MASVNLTGRVPRPLATISGRLVATAVVVFLLLIGAVVYGFHYRLQKQQARKDQQQTQLVASDAAQSNRQSVEGEMPTSSVSGTQSSPTGAASSIATPLVNAARTVAQPFPSAANAGASQSAQTPAAPVYYAPQPMPEVDPQQELRKQALAHRYARQQEALEAPTGAQDQHTATPSTSDPAQADLAQLNNLLRPAAEVPAAAPVIGAPAPVPVPGGMQPSNGYFAQNAQGEKRNFQEGGEAPEDDYLKTTRTPPLSPWVVQRGTVIPAALPHRLVSDLPGDLVAEVARDVYDSPTQKYVMIPAGSRLIGEYNSSVTYGQNRVQVVWTAIYFPDGSFIDLDRMPSHAADGALGLKDQVDNHWKRVIGGVALSSVLAAGLQISQNRTNSSVLTYPSAGQEAAAAIGTQAAQLGEQVTNRNLNIQPTLKIRPGEIFAVSVKKDMLFPGPYEPVAVK